MADAELRRQIECDAGVNQLREDSCRINRLAGRACACVSLHAPLHHLHMQRRRRQIHRRQAHIPRCDAHLVVRPDMAIQHKGNAAGIERCIREIPPPGMAPT